MSDARRTSTPTPSVPVLMVSGRVDVRERTVVHLRVRERSTQRHRAVVGVAERDPVAVVLGERHLDEREDHVQLADVARVLRQVLFHRLERVTDVTADLRDLAVAQDRVVAGDLPLIDVLSCVLEVGVLVFVGEVARLLPQTLVVAAAVHEILEPSHRAHLERHGGGWRLHRRGVDQSGILRCEQFLIDVARRGNSARDRETARDHHSPGTTHGRLHGIVLDVGGGQYFRLRRSVRYVGAAAVWNSL
jgi:hypothetical protein